MGDRVAADVPLGRPVGPGQRPSATRPLASGRTEVPAIGREHVLGALLDVVKAVAGGRGGVCLVTGEAGIGKTRMLGELLTRARLLGHQVLSGRAQDYDHGVAFSALKDLLASLPRDTAGPGPTADLDALLDATDRVVLGRPEPDEERARPPYALATRLLRSLSADRPCVVALDDAHLADDESLTALCLAARHLAGHRLLLVFAARSDKWLPGSGFAATVGRLVESGLGTAVELDALDETDTRALVASVLGGRADDRLVSYVYAQSRGNPLFAREALLSLLERDGVRAEHGTYYLAGEPSPGIVTRRGALLHRVFQQDQANRELARVLSAFGRVHLDDLPLLSQLTSLPAERIQQAFDGLTEAAILRAASDGWYEFAHPLVAEVLYDDLGPAERRRVHRVISEHRDPGPRSRAGLLEWTTHVVEAAAPGDARAIEAALAAATATRDTAPLSAARWYQRALELMAPDAPERGQLLSRQTVAYWKGARPEFAVDTGMRALAELPPGRLRSATLATVVNATYAAGHLEQALELTAAAVEQSGPSSAFLAQRGLVLAHMGRAEEAAQHAARARAALAGSSAEEKTLACSFLGHVAHLVGTFAEMADLARQLEEIGTSGGPPAGTRRSALESSASVLGVAGALSEAQRVLDLAEDVLPLSGQQDLGGQTLHTLAKTQFYAGAWDQALETVRAGAVNLEFAGLWMNVAWLRLVEVDVLLERGQYAEAELLLDAADAPAQWASYRSMRECARASLALGRQDSATALRLLHEQRALGREHGWREVRCRALDALVRLHLEAGRPEPAREAARELQELAAASGMPVLRWTADLAAATTSGDPAPARRTLRLAEEQGLRFVQARACHVLAELGQDPQARLDRASELYEALGAPLWHKQVAARARDLGVHLGRPARPAGPCTAGLTETELQLVGLVRDGLNNLEIAQTLHYSRKTVEAYLSRLYRKMGCHSRVGLVVAVERAGAQPAPPDPALPRAVGTSPLPQVSRSA